MPITHSLAVGRNYSLALYGTPSNWGSAALEAPMVTPGPKRAWLHLFHAAESLSGDGPIGVWDMTDPLIASELAPALAYGADALVAVSGGSRRLGIDVDQDGIPDDFHVLEPVADSEYAVVAIASEATSGFSVVHQVDAAGLVESIPGAAPPFTWVHWVNVHPAFTSTPADFFLAGSSPHTTVPAPVASGRMPMIAGLRTIDVAAAGSGRTNALATLVDVPLHEDVNREIIFWGGATTHHLAVVEPPLTSGIPAGSARVQAFHAAEGYGPVDGYLNGTQVVTGLAPGTASASFHVPVGGTQMLGLDFDRDGMVDLQFDVAGLEDGGAYTLIGALDPTGLGYLFAVKGHGSGASVIPPTY